MWKQLMYKWFGLEELPCNTCEVLRERLAHSESERRELLNRLLEPSKSEPPPVTEREMEPIKPTFVPWRVRQQLLEQEDRKKHALMKDKSDEIEKLEKELGITNAVE